MQPARTETIAATATPKGPAPQPKAERVATSDAKVRGYVVYVAAYASGARAEKLAEQLRGRNLAAQTSVVDKPGQKQLVSVWVGPFDAKAEAQAVLPEIRSAGLEDPMIKAVP
jgi:cell division septation protein DedD